jgi:hypothetical protein
MLSPIICQEIDGLIDGGDASEESDEKRFGFARRVIRACRLMLENRRRIVCHAANAAQ